MRETHLARHLLIAVLLVLGVVWALASAPGTKAAVEPYPDETSLATPTWLKEHGNDKGLVVVDVRPDKNFDGKLIPGAVRLPWTTFQENRAAEVLAGMFVGPDRAQAILGAHGITRTDTVVLYDSVASEGGATASYVFWVLDVLGHTNVKLLAGGIDGWIAAGGATSDTPRTPEPLLYQAPTAELRLDRWVDGEYIYPRLGDVQYQILDVRSVEEYLGQKANKGLDGGALKLGHIPTAVNVDYRLARVDETGKALKSYPQLREVFRGLDPTRPVIIYCHSGRRGSFSYYVLRLMGFTDVRLYDGSMNEWGSQRRFYPLETTARQLSSDALPGVSSRTPTGTSAAPTGTGRSGAAPASGNGAGGKATGGYVSCGG